MENRPVMIEHLHPPRHQHVLPAIVQTSGQEVYRI